MNNNHGSVQAAFCGMLRAMKTTLISLMLIMLPSMARAEVLLLEGHEWAVPKQATTIIAMPAINKTMQAMLQHPNSLLQIRYPGGDEGTLWANELRSWLVALGLASERIELIPGSASHTALELEVLLNNEQVSVVQ